MQGGIAFCRWQLPNSHSSKLRGVGLDYAEEGIWIKSRTLSFKQVTFFIAFSEFPQIYYIFLTFRKNRLIKLENKF
ncbi:MAG: hypothetical protein CFE21_21950 [Bacteroidetes bacterium B1(2017)]|nr:MAG: hypothetical protein CFE21_21950 [Bacteroidetes bacterium B1(2017)]